MNNITLDFSQIIELTEEQFFQLCQNHPDYRFERTAKGELIIMSPTGGETGKINFELAVQLGIWNKRTKLGVAFDSSTGFKLPNGANRSPDAAWIKQERWDNLTTEEKEKFIPLCPDFVVELRSKSDSLTKLQEKMQEYLNCGIKLGWLIDRQNQQVEIYRPNQTVEVMKNPTTLSGENILPRFVLDLSDIL
ncbi:MAG: Uma2 family endonuclease [Microcoleaceae cyanobacterium MO_207.B10]|nr:Uma2 family endonuclease [Microcoleaceae cyanobacterium MO_207.B10]